MHIIATHKPALKGKSSLYVYCFQCCVGHSIRPTQFSRGKEVAPLLHTTLNSQGMYLHVNFPPPPDHYCVDLCLFNIESRGVNLWFHHNTILNRLIGQQYDFLLISKVCRDTILIRFRGMLINMRQYHDNLTQPLTQHSHQLTKKQLHYNLIILFLCSSGYLEKFFFIFNTKNKVPQSAFKCKRFFYGLT